MKNTIALTIWTLLALLAAAVTSTYASDLFGPWRSEHGVYAGGLIANKEVTRNTNAAGGEQLIGRLDTGGTVGGRFGLHSDLLGFDIGAGFSFAQIQVKNEFGVDFPNHGSNLVLLSGDILIYPFRRSLFEGRLKPYATAGIGSAIFAVDSDNIHDKETYTPSCWNSGAGIKYFFQPNKESSFLDLSFRNYRISSSGRALAFDVRAVTIGIGSRF